MSKNNETSSLKWISRRAVLLGLYMVCSSGTAYAAGCSIILNGTDGSVSQNSPFILSSIFNIDTGGNGPPSWMDAATLPINALMTDISFPTSSLGGCSVASTAVGHKVEILFVAPPGSLPSGSGYIVPSNVPGVGLRLQFPGKVNGPIANSIVVAAPTANVNPTGVVTYLPFTLRASWMRTGPFLATPGVETFLNVSNGGAFKIYDMTLGQLTSDAGNPVSTNLRPSNTAPNNIPSLVVKTPACQVGSVGGANTGRQVTMQSVNVTDFNAVGNQGPISTSQKETGWYFSCEALANQSLPEVSFNTAFPGPEDGVALPTADSTLGIQLLMRGVPVQFGVTYPNQPLGGPGAPLTGKYSSDDGATFQTQYLQNNEFNGEVLNIPITFRYYKNGSPLVPGAFSVNYAFTINIF
ncbi:MULTISPECIES: hypothetical protein [unclassified Pseudomonas]|uniref:hypothetical protein n=1 Tax=unclassified Pseudomonas TaxID=196821 RepID=UPI0010329C61|nr:MULTISPECIES: hypothetical protein [unclassified Pseudomonas]